MSGVAPAAGPAMPPWVDLGQPLYEGMSGPAVHGVPRFATEELVLSSPVEGVAISITKISMGAHAGTHVDAGRHFFPDGRTIDEYPLDRFFGPGVVLDLRREGPVALTAGELEAAAPEIRDGDIVFLYFGYAERYGSREYESHPYLTADAADFLVRRGARMVGVDTMTPDLPGERREPSFDFPVHRCLLAEDVLIVENLGPGLKELAGKRALLAAIPLRIVGADGAPTAVLGWADSAPSPAQWR